MKRSAIPLLVLLLSPLQLPGDPGVIKFLLNPGSGDLTTLPWAALLPRQQLDSGPYSSRWGYPPSPNGGNTRYNFPMQTAVGDVDRDGEPDLVLVMEQRLVMAVGFRWSGGQPVGAYLIWAWFDAGGPIHKSGWGRDSGVVLWDVNPNADDGLNEVAVVLRDTATGDLTLTLLGGALSPDADFGNQLRPSVVASHPLRSPCSGGWMWQILNGGWNVNVQRVNVTGGAAARDIMVTDTQSGQPHVFVVDPGPSLKLLFCEGWHSQQGHVAHAFDVDLDGKACGACFRCGPGWQRRNPPQRGGPVQHSRHRGSPVRTGRL